MGKVGRVVHLYTDGDVKVQVAGGSWIFNPLAVAKVSQTHCAEGGNEGNLKSSLSSVEKMNSLETVIEVRCFRLIYLF